MFLIEKRVIFENEANCACVSVNVYRCKCKYIHFDTST